MTTPSSAFPEPTVAIVGAGIPGAAAAARLAERVSRFFNRGDRLPCILQQFIATLAGNKTGWLWSRLKL